jgi:hypothetical protein
MLAKDHTIIDGYITIMTLFNPPFRLVSSDQGFSTGYPRILGSFPAGTLGLDMFYIEVY